MNKNQERQPAQPEDLNRVKYVIHSLSEGISNPESQAGAFWSNTEGWGSLETASGYTTHERMDSFLPISKGEDSEWMLIEEAIDLTRKSRYVDPTNRQFAPFASFVEDMKQAKITG